MQNWPSRQCKHRRRRHKWCLMDSTVTLERFEPPLYFSSPWRWFVYWQRFFLPLDEVWYKVQLMLLRLLKFFNLAAFSTESERMGVSAALQRSACVWLPRKCSPWSPAPAQRCVRGAGGWWAGWRSWIWLPWLRIRPTGASRSTSPPLCNPGSWKESLVKSGDGF